MSGMRVLGSSSLSDAASRPILCSWRRMVLILYTSSRSCWVPASVIRRWRMMTLVNTVRTCDANWKKTITDEL